MHSSHLNRSKRSGTYGRWPGRPLAMGNTIPEWLDGANGIGAFCGLDRKKGRNQTQAHHEGILFNGQKRDESKEPRPCKQGRDLRRAVNAVVPYQQNEEDCASEVGEQRNPRSSVGASVPSRPADGWPAGFSATHRVVDQRV